MHVHLPKPLHGWRAFAGEVGIIVVGVLIALGAEQVVETLHWRSQAKEARDALRSEIQDDDLPQAYARLAIAPCLDAKLKDLQNALDAHTDRSRFAVLARAYKPPARTWDDQAWNAVIATGVLSHGGSQELIQWSVPYRMIVVLRPRNAAESDDSVSLRSINSAQGELTIAERDRVTVALERLRNDEKGMIDGSKILLAAAAQAGVPLALTQKRRALEQLRPEWGACVTEPSWHPVDVNTQSDQQFGY